LATRTLAPWVREGKLIILESTTYPGTTEELVIPILERHNSHGLKVQSPSVPTQHGRMRHRGHRLNARIQEMIQLPVATSRKLSRGTGMDIDIWEVINAASTNQSDFNRFILNQALGGHCIQSIRITSKAQEYDCNTRFTGLGGEVNESMPEHVVHSLSRALNKRRTSTNGARILVLGISYRKGYFTT
jgi:UDP-N-acetyl-D-glucosamine dehydrogenase